MRSKTLSICRANPGVVHLHEVCVGKTLDQIFLVMEFMPHDLKTLLTSFHDAGNGGFKPSEIKRIMYQLLQAVKGLHREEGSG